MMFEKWRKQYCVLVKWRVSENCPEQQLYRAGLTKKQAKEKYELLCSWLHGRGWTYSVTYGKEKK